jgi:outer membrane protein TolC
LPDTGLPVELLRRRPDVAAAYNRVKAADEDLAAAISNQYPRLTLTASLSATEDEALNLFDEWARSFAGDLTAPLLDAGQRRAEVERARAAKMQRLYRYGQTMLGALREVGDALIQEKKQAQRIRSLREQVRLAEETYERLRYEYFNGAGDYIDVLTALTDEQELRRDLLSARLALVEFRIALYRALAGGFRTEREAGEPASPATDKKSD